MPGPGSSMSRSPFMEGDSIMSPDSGHATRRSRARDGPWKAGLRSGVADHGDPPEPLILRRMREHLGGESLASSPCVFIIGQSADPKTARDPFVPLPPTDLPELFRRGLEISRSLWDRQSLIVDLDIEYVNFDFPGEPFLNPGRSFGLQRPVVRSARRLLGQWGIHPLHLYTGRGHHLVWAVDRRSGAFRRLAGLGRIPPPLAARYAGAHPPTGEALDPLMARAFAGLGLVMEYLGHRIRDHAMEESAIPVELSELALGWRTRGLELVVVDLSEYGDPLPSRHIPVPFSPYLKHLRMAHLYGQHVGRATGPLAILPDPGLPEREILTLRKEAAAVEDLARRVATRIPESSPGMDGLLGAYSASELAAFHRYYYAEEQHAPERWPDTYDRTCLDALPPEAAAALRTPNDLLLKPSGLYKVVQALSERGWHPRHIAGLVRSRYERDHGWGWRWHRDSATARADHYVRLFAGMLELGRGPVEEGSLP
jgi:hypothetical protein